MALAWRRTCERALLQEPRCELMCTIEGFVCGTWCLHHVRTAHAPAVLAGVICSVYKRLLGPVRGCAGAYLLACLCNLLYKLNIQCVSMGIVMKDEEVTWAAWKADGEWLPTWTTMLHRLW